MVKSLKSMCSQKVLEDTAAGGHMVSELTGDDKKRVEKVMGVKNLSKKGARRKVKLDRGREKRKDLRPLRQRFRRQMQSRDRVVAHANANGLLIPPLPGFPADDPDF